MRTGFSVCGAAIALALLLGSCTKPTSATTRLDDDVPARPAPGASAATMALAASLGRGINLTALDAPNEGDWGRTLKDTDIDLVHQAGFLTIRLPVRWSNHAATTAPFALDPNFASRVEHLVDHALADGLYVLLDFHGYRQISGETLDPHENAVAPEDVDVRLVALWAQIAERFRGKSPKLLFEILNEPNGTMTAERWNRLSARTVREIRKTNPDRALVIGPIDWNSARGLKDFVVPNDPDLIVTIHNYEPFQFTHQGASWVKNPMPTGASCCTPAQLGRLAEPLDIAAAWSKAHHYPIYLGEFGAYEKGDMESRIRFTRAMRDEAEKRGMGWAYWEFNAGFGIYDPKTGRWRDGLKDALLGR